MKLPSVIADLFRPQRTGASHGGSEAEPPEYFPAISPDDFKLIGRTLTPARNDDEKMLALASEVSRQKPYFTPFTFTIDEDEVVVRQAGRSLAFNRPVPQVKCLILISGYLRWLERKYALPGFCEVEPGDVVIDCGAYVGGFGLNHVGKARAVHFFEPDPKNHACLMRNIGGAAGASAHQIGLHSQTGVQSFNRSASSVEHSFLSPDDGEAVDTIEVEVSRLDDFAKAQGIDAIDFLKIEAEGLEIEVFEGLGVLSARMIAVDVSPERDGESPRAYFEEALGRRGYEVRVRRNVLFARLPG